MMNICSNINQSECGLCWQPAPKQLCDGCIDDLPWTDTHCLLCIRSMPHPRLVCASCQASPVAFDRLIVPFYYEKPISQMIWRLKFRWEPYYAFRLAELFLSRMTLEDRPQLIIPMPMHPLRLFLKGFNQATLLALPMGKALDLPVDCSILRRIRYTRVQRLQKLHVRRRNLAGAFALKRRVDGLHIALVDDVLTTGSSAHYASLCLKAGGAARVDVWAMAATPLKLSNAAAAAYDA